MNSIDGYILYQAVDPLTKTVSPEFYNLFESVGQESIDLMVELKIVMTSNFTRRTENLKNFFRKLDDEIINLPVPMQDWFKKFYDKRISQEVKAEILADGPLQSLDKKFSFDSLNKTMDATSWYTSNTVPPFNSLEQKVPCNAATVPKNCVNSADTALYLTKMARIKVCKDRALGPVITKVATPDKSHGQVEVGDYNFPKRVAKVATEYMGKIQNFLGRNAKYVMDNINFKPSSNNVQTGAPNINIPTKVGGKVVNSTIYGYTVKQLEAKNPFLPKKIIE
jgi:hypothetical protein